MSYDVNVYSTEEDVNAGRMNIEIASRLMHIQKYADYLTEIYIPEIMMHPPVKSINTLVEDVRADYSYTHELDFWPGPHKMNDMRQWVEEMQISCTQVNRLWYFKTEEDRLMFILRWA